MGKDRHSIELEKAHNKGEQDAARGVREEPYSLGNSILSGIFGKDTEEMREENDAYDEGRANYFKQKE